jgi:hypothetical protein
MAESPSLEFIAAQLKLVLDEQRAMRDEQRAMRDEQRSMRLEQRRTAEAVAGLSRSIDHIREDLTLSVKMEIGGLFANLETRLEQRIAAEIEERLPRA